MLQLKNIVKDYHTGDEVVQAQGKLYKDRPQQIDGHVRLGIGIGGVACAEQVEQRLLEP